MESMSGSGRLRPCAYLSGLVIHSPHVLWGYGFLLARVTRVPQSRPLLSAQHSTALHSTAPQHSTALHCTAQHSTSGHHRGCAAGGL
eukprot:4501572-Pyramimonas_sp.AAC.1